MTEEAEEDPLGDPLGESANPQGWSCSKCAFRTDSSADYLKHVDDAHERRDDCKYCGFKPPNRAHLEKHLERDTKNCQYCDFVTCKEVALARHLIDHLQNKCRKCKFVGSGAEGLKAHMAEKHPTMQQQRQQQQQQHQQKLEELSHHRQQQEQQRQKREQKLEELSHHRQQQQQQKVAVEQCTECKYKTANPANMSQHKRIAHPISAQNPLRCLLCDFIAVDEKYINAHLHVAHQIKEDKKCPQCSNAFDSQVCLLYLLIVYFC